MKQSPYLFDSDSFQKGISISLNKILVEKHDFNRDIFLTGKVIELNSGGVCEIENVKESKAFIELELKGCTLTHDDEFPKVFRVVELEKIDSSNR